MFYNLKNNDGFCHLWNESERGLNSEEFASIWVDLIKKLISQLNLLAEPMATVQQKPFFYSYQPQ